MYVKNGLYTPVPLKEHIIHDYDSRFWSLPTFSSIKEDDILVELFAQEQKHPKVYNGEKIDIEIHLGDFSWSCQDMMRFAVQMITNYVKNVGGEIKAIHTERFRDGLGKIAQITVPKDAPYRENLQKIFDAFLHEDDRVIARYKLRHEENKKLPDYRAERKYIWHHEYDTYYENLFSVIAIIAFVLFGWPLF